MTKANKLSWTEKKNNSTRIIIQTYRSRGVSWRMNLTEINPPSTSPIDLQRLNFVITMAVDVTVGTVVITELNIIISKFIW